MGDDEAMIDWVDRWWDRPLWTVSPLGPASPARSEATGAGLTSRAVGSRAGGVPRWLRDVRAGGRVQGRDSVQAADGRETMEQYRHRLAINPLWREAYRAQARLRVKRPVVGIDHAGDGAMAVLETDGRVTMYDSNGQKVWPDPDPVTKAYVDSLSESYHRAMGTYAAGDAAWMQRYRDTYPETYAVTLPDCCAGVTSAQPNIAISPDDGETREPDITLADQARRPAGTRWCREHRDWEYVQHPYGFIREYLRKERPFFSAPTYQQRPAEAGVPDRCRIAWRQGLESVMVKNPFPHRDVMISVFDEEGNDMTFQVSWSVTSQDINFYVMDPTLSEPLPGNYYAIVVA